jgi:hypothetical protein
VFVVSVGLIIAVPLVQRSAGQLEQSSRRHRTGRVVDQRRGLPTGHSMAAEIMI